MVSSSITKRTLAAVGLVIGTLVVLVGAVFLFGQKPTDMRQLFLGAIRGNLQQKSITCTISETKPDTQSSTTQVINLDLERHLARAVLAVKQPVSSVTTEEVQTPKGNFIRYNSIENVQINSSKQKPDLSKVINVWSNVRSDPAQPLLYARSVMGTCIMPLANLDEKQTDKVMVPVERGEIFKTDLNDTKSVKLNGAFTKVFAVTIAPEPYIKWMKSTQKYIGLNNLDTVEDTSFNKSSPAKVDFYINQSTGQLNQIVITASKRSITFTGHGKPVTIETPQNTITSEAMESRLKDL